MWVAIGIAGLFLVGLGAIVLLACAYIAVRKVREVQKHGVKRH